MRLLDLFCGAGGSAVGYHRAGFDEIVGVDNRPMPHYPFRFVLGDALEYLHEHGHEFDAIHASPPCQAYTQAALSERNIGKIYPDLLAHTRNALNGAQWWVIENVPRAPMRPDYRLCGCLFRLPNLRRERWFETSWHGFSLRECCRHTDPTISVVGHGTPAWVRKKLGRNPTIAESRRAMGIEWMTRDELSQAIPPAYTDFIGRQLIQAIRNGTL